MRTIPTTPPSTSSIAPTTDTTATSSSLTTPHSTWHSPVPYLFGGLAAMLGLIAFALLILACSYWKLSGQLQNDEENGERNLESHKQSDSSNNESVKVYEEKILVIMAGDEKPTFLATPKSSFSTHVLPNHPQNNIGNHVTSEKTEKDIENHLQQQQPTSPQQEELTQPHQNQL